MPPPLSNDDRRQLLQLARAALNEVILHKLIPDTPALTGRAAEPGGAFVTLYCQGKLRGCVGFSRAEHSLGETVVQSVILAAQNDPRFAAITAQELPEVQIEISALSELHPISAAAVEVGRHGLLVARGNKRGLLLPKVAEERGWSAQRFLEETCGKAGLPGDAWRDAQTEVLGFTAEVFSEREFPATPMDALKNSGPSASPELKE